MIGRFSYLVAEGVRSLWRARLPALGSALTIALTLVIFVAAFMVVGRIDQSALRGQSPYSMDLFFDDPLLTESQARRIFQKVQAVPGIGSVEFVDKQQAAARFREVFGEEVTAVLGFNPLPYGATLIVEAQQRSAQGMSRLASAIRQIAGVTDVVYQGDIIRFLERYRKYALFMGVGVGLASLLAAIFLVSNTIKLSIYAKKRTMDILALLGATRGFIRLPVLVEGALQGLIGGVLALIAIDATVDLVNYFLRQFHIFPNPLKLPSGWILSVVSMGVSLGIIGSYRSIRLFISKLP